MQTPRKISSEDSLSTPTTRPQALAIQLAETPDKNKNNKAFRCSIDKCQASFKRKVDLKRHGGVHSKDRKYDCRALDCPRTGVRGFAREDKRNDHEYAGHDDDTLFTCPTCGNAITRDLVSVHSPWTFNGLYRTCPLPRCPFKVYHRASWDSFTLHEQALGKLQAHLSEKHELKQRADCSNLLARSAFDFETARLICPLCPSLGIFPSLGSFHEHFFQDHFHGPVCGGSSFTHNSGFCEETCPYRSIRFRLVKCSAIPREIREHRRTILRILPQFEFYPVWEDIKCRGKAR